MSIQIFDAATQRITFSEKHDFRLEDVFEVQDEIAQRVAAALKTRFSIAAPRSRDRYSSDPQAYADFMAGLRASYDDSLESLQRAAEALGRAVERDPEFALAHAWLSFVSMQVHFAFDADRTWLERAERHCDRALTLDASLAEGHWASAAIVWSPAYNFRHAKRSPCWSGPSRRGRTSIAPTTVWRRSACTSADFPRRGWPTTRRWAMVQGNDIVLKDENGAMSRITHANKIRSRHHALLAGLQDAHDRDDRVPVPCRRRHTIEFVDLAEIANRLHVSPVHPEHELSIRRDHLHQPLPV